MNTQQAKRIPLQDILARLGCQPTKQVRGELWYCSPFRPETVPSFKINPERNVWYDFGEGVGGNVLDFVMKFHNVGTISEALDHLTAFDQPRFPAFAPNTPKPILPTTPQLAERPEATVKPLQHKALTTYLAGRGIPLDLASRYLDEIHYIRNGKAYFALAFRNDAGGYELRNPYFKGTHGPKDLTVIPGSLQRIAVFEGVVDFLSAIAAGLLSDPLPTIVVMNSTALRDRAIARITEISIQTVELYLDHDASGRALVAVFRARLRQHDVVDRAELYAGYTDVNAWWSAQPEAHQARGPRAT